MGTNFTLECKTCSAQVSGLEVRNDPRPLLILLENKRKIYEALVVLEALPFNLTGALYASHLKEHEDHDVVVMNSYGEEFRPGEPLGSWENEPADPVLRCRALMWDLRRARQSGRNERMVKYLEEQLEKMLDKLSADECARAREYEHEAWPP